MRGIIDADALQASRFSGGYRMNEIIDADEQQQKMLMIDLEQRKQEQSKRTPSEIKVCL